MKQTCCPQYTIRCAARQLKLTKSQKKTVKKVNKYLNYDIRPHISEKDTLTSDHEHKDLSDISPPDITYGATTVVMDTTNTYVGNVVDLDSAKGSINAEKELLYDNDKKSEAAIKQSAALKESGRSFNAGSAFTILEID